jgi:uncharacterized protein YxjI
MNYPLQLRFKLITIAPQIYVQDATGQTVCHVRQQFFRIKEKVDVYTDNTRTQQICTISADRIIDFNACYSFKTPDGLILGSMRRRGMKSLWKAHYEILNDAGQVIFEIHEQNPFAKIMDSIFGEIPIIGLFSGFFFNPKYRVSQGTTPVLDVTKHRSFLEARFTIEQISAVSAQDELRNVLSLIMFVLLERSRG